MAIAHLDLGDDDITANPLAPPRGWFRHYDSRHLALLPHRLGTFWSYTIQRCGPSDRCSSSSAEKHQQKDSCQLSDCRGRFQI